MAIVRNACLDWLKEHRQRAAEEEYDDDVHGGTTGGSEQPEAAGGAHGGHALAARMHGGIAREYREVLVLRELEELSYKEISAIGGVCPWNGDVTHLPRPRPSAATASRGAAQETLVNCARLRQVLDAWIDNELDHATSDEIAQHLGSCAACASLRRERDQLRAHVRSGVRYHRVPPRLGAAVRRALGASAAGRSVPRQRPSWLQAAALAVVAALVSALAGYWVGRPAPDSTLREHVVASHRGFARRCAPSDGSRIRGSPRRQALVPGKGRFRADRARPVQRWLRPAGRPSGPRGRSPAAAIVYRVRNHVINLFVWRATAGDEPFVVSAARGFNLVTWSDAGTGLCRGVRCGWARHRALRAAGCRQLPEETGVGDTGTVN
jgi:anti-sigma factor RsiW